MLFETVLQDFHRVSESSFDAKKFDTRSILCFTDKHETIHANKESIEGKKEIYVFHVLYIDDDEDENKRDRKSRPARHTDTNRRRNIELSTAKPRQLAQEYQKPVRKYSKVGDKSLRYLLLLSFLANKER